MSVVLYKDKTKTVCDPFSVGDMLKAGWSLTQEKPPEAIEQTEDEIRQAAKDQGIQRWWIKKPETLLKEMASD